MTMPRQAAPVGLRCCFALVLATTAGCLSSAPRIARYEPAAIVTSPQVVAWSDDVWTAARAGAGDRLEMLLNEPPVEDDALVRWHARLNALDAQARAEHRADAVRLMELATSEIDDADRLRALVHLAACRRCIEDVILDALIATILDPTIAQWRTRAEDAEAEDRLEDAIEAWTMVSLLTDDGHHPNVQLASNARAGRLQSRLPGAGRLEPLPPRAIDACVQTVLGLHAGALEWSTLIEAGFDALDSAAAALTGDDRTQADSVISEIRARFFDDTAADLIRSVSTPSTSPSRRLMMPTALRSLSDAASALADARDDGRLPDSMADPIRVFIEGMLLPTDARTRVYLGSDATSIERLLGASFVGIGVRMRAHPDGLALQPLAGSPARRAGIRTGDVLVSIDGKPIDGLTSEQVMARIAGRRGSSVALGLQRDDPAGAITLCIVVTRDEIELESVHGWRQLAADHLGRPIWDWILDPDAGIAFVSIRQFERDTDERFLAAIRDANRTLGRCRMVQGLVLDLRDDPGGDRDATERLLDLFLSTGELIRMVPEESDGPRSADPSRTRLAGLPVVVLVDEHSASASELLAGMLQGAAGAVVVGERTFGKGSVQGVHAVRDGRVLVTEGWFLVRDEDSDGWCEVDRERTTSWGVSPDLQIVSDDRETADILEERGGWRSGRGQDVADDAETVTLETTTDRGLLQALVLLRARTLPSIGPSSTPQ